MTNVRWDIDVSPDTDQAVRRFLADQNMGNQEDLSHLIERAVQSYLFEQAVEQSKTSAAQLSEPELDAVIDEAVQWARQS
ncbi:MAG TPA: ribbon-helix-helix domain-containing protein [Salinisphaeraceae bacterium]|nr:ribbon-helix-helix domain-containing protein [Salinisphaeraceae bacterium]